MKKISNFNSGRIHEIIATLKKTYGVNDIDDLPPEVKLTALCEALQLSFDQFDKLLALNSPVLRTIKGHAFETVFDLIVKRSGQEIKEIGGDVGIDRIVNDITLQLKTPTLSGTKDNIVQFKTHKTHGAKSEQESLDYYHTTKSFADLLVGLISYNPLKIIFLKRDELPTHPKNKDFILSPFCIQWSDHPGLNDFSRIGITKINLSTKDMATQEGKELLPLTSEKLQVATNIILNTILRTTNFRIWDMGIRGFAREMSFFHYLALNNIKQFSVSACRGKRIDKADFALKRSAKNEFACFQIKGVTFNQCRFDGTNCSLAVETQLTRGRVNDHPTQSRLYLILDFDWLIICLDPSISYKCSSELGLEPKLEWQYYAVPTNVLIKHGKYESRLKSLQSFKYQDIQQYRINAAWLNLWEKKD